MRFTTNHRVAVVQNDTALQYQALKQGLCVNKGPVEDRKEFDRIREDLVNALFSEASEEQLRRYVHYQQRSIAALADELSSTSAISGLLDLLDFVDCYFAKYINPDEKLPAAYCQRALAGLQQRIGQLAEFIRAQDFAPGLTSCVLEYLEHFHGCSPAQLTYRGLAYLKEFISELNKEVMQSGMQLTLKLIRLNFNHLGFLSYCQNHLLEATTSPEGQKSVILKNLSLIKAQQFRPGISYDPCWPDIKTMLESSLSDELLFIPPSLEKNTLASAEEKLIVNLSVAQIALIARLFYEEGCYGNATVTDVLKFIAAHYQSKRQEHISAASLTKEYYGVGQKTAAVIQDMLKGMAAKIAKQYFPV